MLTLGIHLAVVVEVVRGSVLLETLPNTERLPTTLHRTLKRLPSMLKHMVLVLVYGLEFLVTGLTHAVLHPAAEEWKAAVIRRLCIHVRVEVEMGGGMEVDTKFALEFLCASLEFANVRKIVRVDNLMVAKFAE